MPAWPQVITWRFSHPSDSPPSVGEVIATSGRPLALLGLLAALALGGCGPARDQPAAPAVPTGRSTQTITVDGRTRTFHLYVPTAPSSPAPLVVMLHGGFGTGTQAEKSYHWDERADQDHFVVAYPDGVVRAWNTGGGCCGQPAADNVDDVAFLTDMIATIQRQIPVDPHRIYATGISNGAIMAYTLACRTTLLAAIGPDSGTQLGGCASPAPLSVIHVHGTADENIPYHGGTGSGVAHIDGPPVPQVNAYWRQVDSCSAPQAGTSGAVTTSIASCPSGRAVELITIAGAGHQWPGAVSDPLTQRILGLDPPSTALDATATIWQFFAAHPK